MGYRRSAVLLAAARGRRHAAALAGQPSETLSHRTVPLLPADSASQPRRRATSVDLQSLETMTSAVDIEELRAAADAAVESLGVAPGPALPAGERERELRRFLAACGGVVPKAAHVYARALQWRQQEGLDGILAEAATAEREPQVRRFMQYVDGLRDRSGRRDAAPSPKKYALCRAGHVLPPAVPSRSRRLAAIRSIALFRAR